jgi:hypothetical protein
VEVRPDKSPLAKCQFLWHLAGLAESLLAKLCAWKGPLFLLPSGGHLKYQISYRGAKGNQFKWRLNAWHMAMYRRILKKSKTGKPLLGLLNGNSGEILLAVDIDHLSLGFANWDELAAYLENLLPENSIAIRSPSGKCKLLILFHYEGYPQSLSQIEKEQALRWTLFKHPNLAWLIDTRHIDVSANAMSVAYLPSLQAIHKIASRLPNLKALDWPGLALSALTKPSYTPTNISISGHFSAPEMPAPAEDHRYSIAIGMRHQPLAEAVAELAISKRRLKSSLLDMLIKILEGQRGLASSKGFALSSKKLARELFGKVQGFQREDSLRRAINRYLLILIKAGLLEIVSEAYRYVRRGSAEEQAGAVASARSYRALGPLLEAIEFRFADNAIPIFDRSAQIQPGKWNVISFIAANDFYPRLDEYVAWVLSREGICEVSDRPSKFWLSWRAVCGRRGMHGDALVREREKVEKLIRLGMQHVYGVSSLNAGIKGESA